MFAGIWLEGFSFLLPDQKGRNTHCRASASALPVPFTHHAYNERVSRSRETGARPPDPGMWCEVGQSSRVESVHGIQHLAAVTGD